MFLIEIRQMSTKTLSKNSVVFSFMRNQRFQHEAKLWGIIMVSDNFTIDN